jgi:ribonuclease P protein component
MAEADNSFSKDYRLLSASDFSYLRKDSQSVSHKWVRLYYKKSKTNSSHSRIGIAVTKKVGKANKRNLCKRVIRDYFRNSSYKELGLDVLVLVSPRLFQRDHDHKAALRSSLEFCFNSLT